jgi:hypothetical protein
MSIETLKNQASGLQSNISNYENIISNPNTAESYRIHAQMQIDQWKSELAGIQAQIAKLTNDAELAAAAQAQIEKELADAAALQDQIDQATGYTPTTPIEELRDITPKYTEATYQGLPTSLGGTWGNTPATLAAQTVTGDQIKYTITDASGNTREATKAEAEELTAKAIESLSPEQKTEYKAALKEIKAKPETVTQAVKTDIGALSPTEKQAAKITSVTGTETANIKPEELYKTTTEPIVQKENLVEVKGNQYVEKSVFDTLTAEEQKVLKTEGFDAFEKYLDKQEKTAAEKQKAAIQDTKARIQDIKTKQEKYEAQSLWDKVADTLQTPVKFSELVQETLSIGALQTEAFDSDAIENEYLEARLNALESGSDLGISFDDYKKQVLEKQTTAEELGMQLVPFEYVRPGRWDELQLWEKIVYPALDIVIIVPVVGLAAKGVSALAKTASAGARIASLGGKAAIEFAAKDAALMAEKAATQKAVKEGLLAATKEAIKTATDPVQKKVLNAVLKDAVKDVKVANTEYKQIVKNAEELAKLNNVADKVKTSTVYKTSSATEKGIDRVSRYIERYIEPVDAAYSTGEIGYSTVANWNDLTPEQMAAGLGLAVLTSGAVGKGLNVAENILNPYKIPIAALKPRQQLAKAEAGKIYNPGKEGLKGTDRLLIDHTMDPEKARMTVADVQKQLVSGKDIAKSKLETAKGIKEVKVKGTGLQKTVGKTGITATPMGEIGKAGTGAAGMKSNLEKALEKANKKYGTNIEIEGKPLKIGTEEIEVKTISVPGLTVKGKEGGMYLGAGFYNQFAHRAAAGGKGKISAGYFIGLDDIAELPEELKNIDINKRYEAALKYYDGSKDTNKVVEGFKRWGNNMELENFITNGTQIQRTQNLRSKLADMLHQNKGEYFTRDKSGRIELFQMYMEGGRSTPYTLKELYQLKGNALKNSLEDLFFGFERKIDDLKEGKLFSHKENVITKEEQLAKAFNNVDEAVAKKGLSDIEAKRLKNEILSEYRSRLQYVPDRQALRAKITKLATRTEAMRKADRDETQRLVDSVRKERLEAKRKIISNEPIERRTESKEDQRKRLNSELEKRTGKESVRDISKREETRKAEDRKTEERKESETREAEDREAEDREAEDREAEDREAEDREAEDREAEDREAEDREAEDRKAEDREAEDRKAEDRKTEERKESETRKTEDRKTEARSGIKDEMRTSTRSTTIIKNIENETDTKLSKKQIEGAVAWKQGLFYRLHYPPFGKIDKIVTREPIPGVPYHEGIGSAAKSIVALYGEIPQDIRLDMGIVDIDISKRKNLKQPELKFKADPKQKTNYAKQAIRNVK